MLVPTQTGFIETVKETKFDKVHKPRLRESALRQRPTVPPFGGDDNGSDLHLL